MHNRDDDTCTACNGSGARVVQGIEVQCSSCKGTGKK